MTKFCLGIYEYCSDMEGAVRPIRLFSRTFWIFTTSAIYIMIFTISQDLAQKKQPCLQNWWIGNLSLHATLNDFIFQEKITYCQSITALRLISRDEDSLNLVLNVSKINTPQSIECIVRWRLLIYLFISSEAEQFVT